MENWKDLANDCRKASNQLLIDDYHRSSISRAYYAVYSRIAFELIQEGVQMPTGREGPNHAKLRVLVESNLYNLSREKRLLLSQLVGRLYAMRVMADYSPALTVSARDNREAASIMKKCFDTI